MVGGVAHLRLFVPLVRIAFRREVSSLPTYLDYHCRLLLGDALERLQSSIIATSSVKSPRPTPQSLAYDVTMAAVANFVAAPQLLGEKGIRVSSVAPGLIWTPLTPSTNTPANGVENCGSDTPLGRAGQPPGAAPVHVLLLSDEGSSVYDAQTASHRRPPHPVERGRRPRMVVDASVQLHGNLVLPTSANPSCMRSSELTRKWHLGTAPRRSIASFMSTSFQPLRKVQDP